MVSTRKVPEEGQPKQKGLRVRSPGYVKSDGEKDKQGFRLGTLKAAVYLAIMVRICPMYIVWMLPASSSE